MAIKKSPKTKPTVVDDDDFEGDELTGDEGQASEEAPPETVKEGPAAEPPPPPRPRSRRVSLDVELGPKPAGIYVGRHLEVRLENPQAETLRKLFDGLALRAARLENGSYVRSVPDAVRWLLEEIGRREAGGVAK